MDPLSKIQPNLGQASIAAVNQYLQLALAQQIDVDVVLNDLDIKPAILSDNSEQLSGSKFQQLIAQLINLSKDPLFGLHTAQFVQPASYSVLGFISMNCETLGEAISKIPSFEKLVGDMGTTSFSNAGEHFQIIWHCLFPNQLVRRHMIDNCLASWLNFAHYLADKKTPPVKVFFTRKRPSSKQQLEYEALFNCPVLFNQQSDSIYFRKSLLEYPLKRGNKQLLNSLESHANKQLENLSKEKDFATQTKKIISLKLQTGHFHQQDVASILSMSTKTLQRKLRAESTSFIKVLDQTRLEKAEHLLTSSLANITEISLHLGFSEARSFYRWFQKLTNKTPSQFRREER